MWYLERKFVCPFKAMGYPTLDKSTIVGSSCNDSECVLAWTSRVQRRWKREILFDVKAEPQTGEEDMVLIMAARYATEALTLDR